MGFKVKFLIVLICFFSFSGKAQSDSSDLNFYSTPVELLNFDDSLFYGGDSGYFDLHLEFDIEDTASIGRILVELVATDFGNNSFSAFSEGYAIEEFGTLGYLDLANHVNIPLRKFPSHYAYEIVIRILDDLEQEVVLIAKKLIE